MPREHSKDYKDLVQWNNDKNEFWLIPEQVKEKLQHGEINYETMTDLLRETNDAQFGIVSTLNEDTKEWIRDATNSIPLGKRMSHDATVIDANNTLLRCLSRLRPIDYAIEQKHGNAESAKTIRDALRTRFAALSEEILNIAQRPEEDEEKQKQIQVKEKEFNTFLVQQLHEANLTKKCENEKDAEKLLFHYRNLSSVLSPARTMITLTYDKTAKILQRETQYPVVEKTAIQKEALKKLGTITPYPFKDEKNSHTSQKVAIQEADSLFATRIDADDSALPAQARKTHLVGAKNAFIVKNELIQIDDTEINDKGELNLEVLNKKANNEKDVLWLARMGSPVFVGKGENSKTLQEHTRENLQQVRLAAAEKMGKDADSLSLHVTSLNTVTFLEHQSTIIDHVYKATRKEKGNTDDMSYMPTNDEGTLRFVNIAKGLDFDGKTQPSGSAPLRKATRLEEVTQVMLAASNKENTLSVVHCASGQDRTGTAVETTTQKWMKQRYKAKDLGTDNIESMRAEGGNAAEITTHHVNGSPGMKTDSIADNFFGSKTTFSPEATKQFYLKSAKTNKENKIDNVAFLKKPSTLAIEEYKKELANFEANLRQEHGPAKQQLIEKGSKVLEQVKAIKDDPEELDSRSLNDLTQVLATANRSLTDANDPVKSKANAKQLAALSQHVSGKSSPSWKALGIGLLFFACAVVGVLAAVPSGGSSLLITAAAAAGLAATIGVSAGLGVAAVAGVGMMIHGREKGLAKSVSEFKEKLNEIKREPPAIEPKHEQEQEQGKENLPLLT